jgi:predicted enzyme related to lactoylglutathione lyase
MKPNQITSVIYPVKDLDTAKKLYSALLGVEPYFDQPFYVGFKIGNQEIGLDPNGFDEGMTGPVGYWQVEDIHESLKKFIDAGATKLKDIQEVGGGMLMASVKDTDGNTVGLLQYP